MIADFRERYAPLHPFARCEILFDGIVFSYTMQVLCAALNVDKYWRCICQEELPHNIYRDALMRGMFAHPLTTGQLSSLVTAISERMSDTSFSSALWSTGTQQLIFRNEYGDSFWGMNRDPFVGENYYGRILMLLRDFPHLRA